MTLQNGTFLTIKVPAPRLTLLYMTIYYNKTILTSLAAFSKFNLLHLPRHLLFQIYLPIIEIRHLHVIQVINYLHNFFTFKFLFLFLLIPFSKLTNKLFFIDSRLICSFGILNSSIPPNC